VLALASNPKAGLLQCLDSLQMIHAGKLGHR
jgi:hypothetical protein